MPNVDQRGKGPPGPGLVSWLNRMIHQGALKTLPRYHSVRGRAQHSPDRYALDLLEGLTSGGNNPRAIEQIKDDGRAFRSWVETSQAHGPRVGDQTRGFTGQAG